MMKKLIVMIIMLLSLMASSAVYASAPLDELDDRYETENIAGMTWDQISELADNSPNSLTPIQGLVLWMFAILAFLKLAQKMDNLLQSLGLNVTQTGGRALGDLMVAGMAIRNIGNAISRGTGMSGPGRGVSAPGGGSGASGTGTASAGSFGQAPIPSGGSMPLGQQGTSSQNSSQPKMSEHKGSNDNSTANRNPIGKATDWFKQDGFAQGAVKAGAKGGLIGVGAYSAKAGASAIKAATSHTGDINPLSDGISTDYRPTENQNIGLSSNPENYHEAKPLDSSEANADIPTNINTEEYHEAKPSDGFESEGSIPADNDAFTDMDMHGSAVESEPIPASVNDGQDAETDAVDFSHNSQPRIDVSDSNGSAVAAQNTVTQDTSSSSGSGDIGLPKHSAAGSIPSDLHGNEDNLVVSNAALPQNTAHSHNHGKSAQSYVNPVAATNPETVSISATHISTTPQGEISAQGAYVDNYEPERAQTVKLSGSNGLQEHGNQKAVISSGTNMNTSAHINEPSQYKEELTPSSSTQVVHTQNHVQESQSSVVAPDKITSESTTKKVSGKSSKRNKR